MKAESVLAAETEQRGPYPEGAIVRLRAGSPPLTVEDNRTDGMVSVVWFDQADGMHRDVFHPAALEINVDLHAFASELLTILKDIFEDGMQDGLSDDLRNRVEAVVRPICAPRP